MNRQWTRIWFAIFSLQILFFFIVTISIYTQPETKLVIWDEFGYYQEAVKVFENNGFEFFKAMQNSNRPVFTWFNILIIQIASLGLNYRLLAFLNTISYQIILVAAFCYILKIVKIGNPLICIGISILYAMPVFFDISIGLLGDLACAAWVMLFSAFLVALSQPSLRIFKLISLGIVAALGFQTKPIFLLYLVTSLTCFILARMVDLIFLNREQKIKSIREFLTLSIFFIVPFAIVLYFIFPKNLLNLISDLAYNNETLGYWVANVGIFNSYLWLLTVIFDQINILAVLICTLLVIWYFLIKISRFKNVNRKSHLEKQNIYIQLASQIQEITNYPLFSIVISFIIIVLYVSLKVNFKDARTLLFLLPIAAILLCQIISSVSKYSKLNYRLVNILMGTILVCNFFNALVWNPKLPENSQILFNSYLDLRDLKIKQKNAFASSVNSFKETYQSLGIGEVIETLEKDCQPSCLNQGNLVFIPHGTFRYNDTTFSSFNLINKYSIYTNNDSLKKLNYISALFQYGGWGHDGGIPKTFFTANYIVFIKNYFQKGTLAGDTEIYNQSIHEYLSQGKSEFVDGLEKIYEKTNRIGDTIVIYKRNKKPTAENFVKIVKTLTARDKNNLWNVPFIYAALKIQPDLSDLSQQLEEMSKIVPLVKYNYGNPQQAAEIREIIGQRNENTYQKKIDYPAFLDGW